MSAVRRILAALFTIAALAAAPSTASGWAPASQAQVTPGVQTDTAGGQCTSNFVFTSGSDVFIGQAAHCAGTGAATETDGCDAQSLPLGTPVAVSGATQPGTLAYSSWLTMQEVGETDPDACAYNDFALVRIDPADVGRVNPSVPRFGGPVGLGGGPSAAGDVVYSYGNSSLRLGIRQLSPKQGIVVETVGNGWSRTVYTATPGIPGDSGSGFLDANGAAVGTLSTLAVLPTPLSNGVADLGRELDYARAHGGLADLQLVDGTEPFRPNLLTAILGG
jgi:hypothetical protein